MRSFSDENEGIKLHPYTLGATACILLPTAFLFRGREFQQQAIPLHCNLNDPNEATAPELSLHQYSVAEGKYLWG